LPDPGGRQPKGRTGAGMVVGTARRVGDWWKRWALTGLVDASGRVVPDKKGTCCSARDPPLD
jgi:hypothetical protein